MSDAQVRELERAWKSEGTWEAWCAWVAVLRRVGDERGNALRKIRRAARGWLACREREAKIPGLFVLSSARPGGDLPSSPRFQALILRCSETKDRHMRAYCRAMGEADRLEVVPDMRFVDDWPSKYDGGNYDAGAMHEAAANTTWEPYDDGDPGEGYRRRLIEDVVARRRARHPETVTRSARGPLWVPGRPGGSPEFETSPAWSSK